MFRNIVHGWVRSAARLRPRATRLRVEELEARALLSAAGLDPQLLLTMSSGAMQTVKLDDGADVAAALATWRADAQVAGAEIDQRVSIATVPNDSRFSSMWGMLNTGQAGGTSDADIDADLAWNLATGSMATAVSIIDTGIDYTHPDLYKNIWLNQGELPTGLGLVDTDADGLITFWDLNTTANAGKAIDANSNGRIEAYDILRDTRWENGQDNDGNGKRDDLVGWDFVNNDNDPLDDNGHGTHVAGTIGAMGNNSLGVVGVAWKASLAALKFLGADGGGYTSAAVAALNYAVGEGIKISNNSWGGGGYSSALATAISNARAAGHIFVAAAGNEGRNNDTTANYPANLNYDNIISVASTTRTDTLSGFSNYGATTVDLAAPGSSILSTTPNNTYSSYSGTSMATPHVAGAAALVWSANPSLSYSQVIARILNNVDNLSSLSGRVATGGRLNVYNALAGSTADTTGPRVISAAANTFTNSTPVAIRDRTTLVSTITVGQDLTIADLNVRLNIAHTWDADLYGYLRGPDGTIVNLVAYRGGSGDNFSNTTFDDEAAVSIASGAAPFAGSHRPERSLAAFDGKNARGTWALYVYDRAYLDTGTLQSWSLEFSTGASAQAAATDVAMTREAGVFLPDRLPAETFRDLAALLAAARHQGASSADGGNHLAVQQVTVADSIQFYAAR